MIKTLTINNYALIDAIELTFSPGLNIITGETGAGKSIMLGALSMLLGNRADTRAVTDRERKSVVEATFVLTGGEGLKSICQQSDIDWDDNNIILRREISPNGRSRSFVNDSPVSLSLLREVAMRLVDLHSQHQNLLLATPEYQLSIIDSLLPDKSLLELYHSAYDEYRAALKQYSRHKRSIEAAKAEEEYLRYQYEKLTEIELADDMQDDLERERDLLSNITDVKQSLGRLDVLFADENTSLSTLINEAQHIAPVIESLPDGKDIIERIDSLSIEIDDLGTAIANAYHSIDVDPERLATVEDTLSDLYSLQRKHNVATVTDLIALRDRIASQLGSIDNADDRLQVLASRAKRAKAVALKHAHTLSEARCAVASQFAATLRESALPLGMKNLQVSIDIVTGDLTPTGIDTVTFLFAFNKNQPLMPVRDTASGGEISRLMLSVKAILADKMSLPSIIFDEVDTGVSGDVANRMGQLMKQISANIQVIAITHLPQVAAKGNTHFKVYKEDTDTRTHTRVITLDDSQRIDELAMMLSGDSLNNSARLTAQSLIEQSSNNS